MNKILLKTISAIALGGLFTVHAQNGFVVWSKGGDCERELHYNSITNGTKVGEPKLVIAKGPGADIWPNISYDGEWIAWCRSPSAHKGGCDYHSFGSWDVYVARIDYGKTLPVKPIKVANGYFPMWGEDARTPNAPKTLYFTKYSDQTIQKTTIKPDGTFTPPVEHARCPKKVSGSDAHTQGSPDGKFILYRPSKMQVYSIEAKKNIGPNLGGCHPSWGPRSKYFIRAGGRDGAYFNTGTDVIKAGNRDAGVGDYFFGISNDAYYDEGRLWTIGRITPKGSTQNQAGKVMFSEIAIDGKGGWQALIPKEKDDEKVLVGEGSACDIHMFPPDFDPNGSTGTIAKNMNISDNRISFTTQIKTATSGLQLVVNSQNLAGYTAGLYTIQGKQVAYMRMSGSSQNIMPLRGITDGKYFLKISNHKESTQKGIWISR